jgi:hypothetical protein
MKKLFNLFSKLYDTEVPAQGLALFRIVYCVILFAEVWQIGYFQHLILDPIPYIQEAEVSFALPLTLWLFVIFMLMIGAFTRVATVINYCFTLFTLAAFNKFEYHLDYGMTGINFLFLFIPIERAFSVDRLLDKLKYSTLKSSYIPSSNTSILSYFSLVGLGIAIVYFDSMFYKLASPMWMSGLGFWWPATLPFATYLDLSFILNNKFLSHSLGFITLIFEGVFLFFIWNKKFRFPLIVVGLGLHLGILIAYPIPLFALGITGLYILLLPYDLWTRMHNKLKGKKTSLTVYYDEECPLGNRTKIIVGHFDFFAKIQFKGIQTYEAGLDALKNIVPKALPEKFYSVNASGKVYEGLATYIQIFARVWFLWPISLLLRLPGISYLATKMYASIPKNTSIEVGKEANYSLEAPTAPPAYDKVKILNYLYVRDVKVVAVLFFVLYCIFSQMICISQGILTQRVFRTIGVAKWYNSFFQENINGFYIFNRKSLGITKHPVFMDKVHFDRYNHIVAVVHVASDGKETWLPIVNEDGQVRHYITGREWVEWTFRSNGKDINMNNLLDGIQRYSAFWAKKHEVSLETKAIFKIKVKKIDSPRGWEENFLRNQMAKPWIDAGVATWENNKCDIQLPDVETL